METKKIALTIADRGGGNSTSFSGRRKGQEVRKKYSIDSKDKDKDCYVIEIPNDTTSFNPSFYLGLLFVSIKTLGFDKFKKKYTFDLKKLNNSLRPYIKQNLEECQIRAFRELQGSTGFAPTEHIR